MKKASSFMASILLFGILIVPGVGAFEKGENRIANGDFETDNVGEVPNSWEINKGG
jgi:hypothetical protein